MNHVTTTNANRCINGSRLLNAPVELVWEVWTQPEHIKNWWGPDGFTNTIHQMDFHENGEWKLTMHGPDGSNYPNRSIYKEIVPQQKIMYEHFNPHFIATVVFEAKGQQTLLDWTLEFDTADMRDTVVKAHNAAEGLQQNLAKINQYAESLLAGG